MMNFKRFARLLGAAAIAGVWLVACTIALAPQCCSAAVFADSLDDWSFTGMQGENNWTNGWRNYTADGEGAYTSALFIPFLNDGTGVISPGNQWTGSDYAMANLAAPWTRLGQEYTHPASPQPPATSEEHWTIRRWASTVSGQVTLKTHLRADNTGPSGTTNELYVNGNLLDTYSTNSPTGITSYVQTTLAVGDIVDLAFTPVGTDGHRGDGSDGSFNRLTISDEAPPLPIMADSADDWSASGAQGHKGWTDGIYNLTADPDGTYQTTDFMPYLNDGSGVLSPANHWNGYEWHLTDTPGPWTMMGQENVHPNAAGVGSDEHWAIRRWESTVTEATPVAIKWQARKTNLANDGVTGVLMVNGVQVDASTITGNDSAGVNNTFYVNLQPGDVIDLALSPEGLTNRTDGNDGSATRLTIDPNLPAGPLRNPTGVVLANSVAEHSGVQGQDGWQYGYYDQRDDAENSDGVYGADDFIAFPDDDGDGTSDDDFWDNANNKWDWHAGNPPWTELTQTGGHPAGNGWPDDSVHWTVRRWTNTEVDDDFVRIEGLLLNGGGGDGTVGRILVDGIEVFSALSDGNLVPFSLDLEIALGAEIDFAIDPDGAGNYDPADLASLDLITDGGDGSTFFFTIKELAEFHPIPEPSSVSLFLAGLVSLAVWAWRRRR